MGEDEDAGPDPCLSAPALPPPACAEGCQEQGYSSCLAHSSAPLLALLHPPLPTSTQSELVFKL